MSEPQAPPQPPQPPTTPDTPPRSSRAYRLALAVFAGVAAVLAIAGMVRYTHRVERSIVNSGASTESVSLLRDRMAAPLFTAPEIDGGTFSLAAYHGKVVLVNFWATWCPPCREEIPSLIALQTHYKDQLQIIGIAQDSGSAADVEAFAKNIGINYPVVLATPEIERSFPPTAYLPTTFIVDREGKIAQKHVGMLNPSLTETETRVLAGLEPNATIVYAEDHEKERVASAAQANKIPGIDLEAVAANKRGDVLKALNEQHCTCGCDLTIAQCRIDDPTCGVSLPLAQQIVSQINSQRPTPRGGK
jgi:thiol-disulfide isomerase/thioredoxin